MRKFSIIAEILQHAEVYVTRAFDSRQGTATLYTHLQLLLSLNHAPHQGVIPMHVYRIH